MTKTPRRVLIDLTYFDLTEALDGEIARDFCTALGDTILVAEDGDKINSVLVYPLTEGGE